jgi:hypothetical protein
MGKLMKSRARQVWCEGLILLCLGLALTACGDSDPESRPLQTLMLDDACDVRSGCIGRNDDLSASVRMSPHRSALKPFNVALTSDAALEVVTVSLEMPGMDMGQNRYRLLQANEGSWQAEITLPICTSGRSDWVAVFELQTSDKRYQLSVPFTLGG